MSATFGAAVAFGGFALLLTVLGVLMVQAARVASLRSSRAR